MPSLTLKGFLTSTVAVVLIACAQAGELPTPLQDDDYLHDGAPDPAVVDLGRMLFFDPILSGNRNISCGTCHDPGRGTGDELALSIGEGGRRFRCRSQGWFGRRHWPRATKRATALQHWCQGL
ncbi:cytochrome-c peroxidase [Roseibium album]|uniref:cytochrome-c peroxidase n=1 Tax=Roseibium album TaxID=311410 RepID=UPI00248FCAB1|nr:cytochrome-c peroxidase [Roseibium album]